MDKMKWITTEKLNVQQTGVSYLLKEKSDKKYQRCADNLKTIFFFSYQNAVSFSKNLEKVALELEEKIRNIIMQSSYLDYRIQYPILQLQGISLLGA